MSPCQCLIPALLEGCSPLRQLRQIPQNGTVEVHSHKARKSVRRTRRSRSTVPARLSLGAAAMANKQQLLHFLDQHVFNPILKASPKGDGAGDEQKLKDVQDRTRSERDRFHHYSSAREIVDNYKSDLHSKTAHRVNQDLEALGLPTLPSVKDEFLKLAEGNSD